MLANNYSSKYWLNNDIKDCSNNLINDELELIIDIDEKLKDNYNNELNTNKLNAKSKQRNQNFTFRDRNYQNTKNDSRSEFSRYENKNNRVINSKETNKYINLSRTNYANNNQKNMSKLSSSSRISEYKGRNLLLDTFPKPRIKDLL
jgi:hypothetical protein